MTQSFVEYRDVGSSEPLRQGDVLESVDPGASKWDRNLFVLTADCDFAHDKHMGRVTCVPILSSEEYLLEACLPQFRERLVQDPLLKLQKLLAKVGSPNVTPSRVREWIAESTTEDVLGALNLEDSDWELARRHVDAIRLIDMPMKSLVSVTNNFVEAQLLASSPPTRGNAARKVSDRVKLAFAQTPGDALFLSAIAPAHEGGYFAYLRHLEQVWQPDISIGPAVKGAKYRRIARLQDRFTHALVQRFGLVFMSIGLPTEYEEMRTLHAELIGDGIE